MNSRSMCWSKKGSSAAMAPAEPSSRRDRRHEFTPRLHRREPSDQGRGQRHPSPLKRIKWAGQPWQPIEAAAHQVAQSPSGVSHARPCTGCPSRAVDLGLSPFRRYRQGGRAPVVIHHPAQHERTTKTFENCEPPTRDRDAIDPIFWHLRRPSFEWEPSRRPGC